MFPSTLLGRPCLADWWDCVLSLSLPALCCNTPFFRVLYTTPSSLSASPCTQNIPKRTRKVVFFRSSSTRSVVSFLFWPETVVFSPYWVWPGAPPLPFSSPPLMLSSKSHTSVLRTTYWICMYCILPKWMITSRLFTLKFTQAIHFLTWPLTHYHKLKWLNILAVHFFFSTVHYICALLTVLKGPGSWAAPPSRSLGVIRNYFIQPRPSPATVWC